MITSAAPSTSNYARDTIRFSLVAFANIVIVRWSPERSCAPVCHAGLRRLVHTNDSLRAQSARHIPRTKSVPRKLLAALTT